MLNDRTMTTRPSPVCVALLTRNSQSPSTDRSTPVLGAQLSLVSEVIADDGGVVLCIGQRRHTETDCVHVTHKCSTPLPLKPR